MSLLVYDKIIIAKTFFLSKLDYILQALSPPVTVLTEKKRVWSRFLEEILKQKAFQRVKTKHSNSRQEEGLGMINLKEIVMCEYAWKTKILF